MRDEHNNHSRCKALFARLSEYLDNELNANTRQRIEAHLQKCPPCRACVETLKRTVALCRGSTESVPMPEGFSRRLKAMFAASRLNDRE